ncbi:MAG: hypothetical protein QXL94_01985 [Candidatus Parvarchaeum sp.]
MEDHYNEYEDYKILRRIEKIEELALIYLRMATNRHKSTMAAKFRSDTEAEALREIVNEVNVVEEELERVEGNLHE